MSTRRSAREKGRRAERRVAAALGGKRTPLSGAAGGSDVTLPPGAIWADWQVEVKARARVSWTTVREALDQAEHAAQGTRRRPLAVVVPDRERPVACMRLDDLIVWAEALAEIGRGWEVRRCLQQARRALDEAEGLL